jgi:hypothetical protein
MSIPGMIYPTQKGMLAGNPRDSAIAQMNNTNMKQTSLANAVGGKHKRMRKSKKIKRHRKGGTKRRGGSTVAVPQFTLLYNVQSGPGTDPNSQIKMNSQISTQGAANAVYDQEATKTGGSRTCRRFKRTKVRGGDNPDWHWGCKSGGRKRKSRKTKIY